MFSSFFTENGDSYGSSVNLWSGLFAAFPAACSGDLSQNE